MNPLSKLADTVSEFLQEFIKTQETISKIIESQKQLESRIGALESTFLSVFKEKEPDIKQESKEIWIHKSGIHYLSISWDSEKEALEHTPNSELNWKPVKFMEVIE